MGGEEAAAARGACHSSHRHERGGSFGDSHVVGYVMPTYILRRSMRASPPPPPPPSLRTPALGPALRSRAHLEDARSTRCRVERAHDAMLVPLGKLHDVVDFNYEEVRLPLVRDELRELEARDGRAVRREVDVDEAPSSATLSDCHVATAASTSAPHSSSARRHSRRRSRWEASIPREPP